ncbi:hypothetical protein BO71DRAFT_423529 [Aspergillus ellipticus CBS 707.79]|uniref:C2H2-type domain-containing protein n=1 Tax=Aspergillus ellipticus CBS 707.79 TaxID=1448320 RepID=A0A319CW04_9EURO|nr:hypothetical protein BO71DRAFT_423529 [Aspergillus ellipticus CBS 707.79]
MFGCQFPGCNASYRRKEHLHRHEAKHVQQQVEISDTLRRHVRQHHKIIEPLKRARRACEGCYAGRCRCEGGFPCNECVRRKIPCSLGDDASTHRLPCRLRHDRSQPYHSKEEESIRSFDMRHEMPLLIQSMVVIGLWASGKQPAQSAAVALHDKLDLAIRDQKVEGACSACSWPIATYQAILLHIIFSFVLKGQGALNFDLSVSLPAADFELLEALVRSCRRLGMFYYPNILARYKDSDLTSFVWVGIEEIKRFNMALYKFCAKTSRSSAARDGNQNDNGAVRPLLTARELLFPLPTNNPFVIETVHLDDDCQADWISNFAGVLEFFEL